MSDIVAKLWGFCHTLKHDGIGYSFCVEQRTFVLFIKMAEERAREESGDSRRHLRKGAEPLQQGGQPQETHLAHRRGGVVEPRRRGEGARLRGAA